MSKTCQTEPTGASGIAATAHHEGPTVNRSDAVRRVVQLVNVDQCLIALCSDGSVLKRDTTMLVDFSVKYEWIDITPPGCGGGGLEPVRHDKCGACPYSTGCDAYCAKRDGGKP